MEKAKFMNMVDNDTTRRLPCEKIDLSWDVTFKFDPSDEKHKDFLIDRVAMMNNIFKPENEVDVDKVNEMDIILAIPYIASGRHHRENCAEVAYDKYITDATKVFNQIQERNEFKTVAQRVFAGADAYLEDDMIWSRFTPQDMLVWIGMYQSPNDNIHMTLRIAFEIDHQKGEIKQTTHIYGESPTFIVQKCLFPVVIQTMFSSEEQSKSEHADKLIGMYMLDNMEDVRDFMLPPTRGNLSAFNKHMFVASSNNVLAYVLYCSAQERAKEKENENA